MNFLACDLGGTKVLLGIFERVINDAAPKLFLNNNLGESSFKSFLNIPNRTLVPPKSQARKFIY